MWLMSCGPMADSSHVSWTKVLLLLNRSSSSRGLRKYSSHSET